MMTILSVVTLFFSILCMGFICYALWKNKIFYKEKIVVLKKYRFYGRYISICTYNTKENMQIIIASIEPDEKTIGDNIIFRYKYDINAQSRHEAVSALENMIISSFKNTITHIEQDAQTYKCNVRCPENCDCKYWENTEMQ